MRKLVVAVVLGLLFLVGVADAGAKRAKRPKRTNVANPTDITQWRGEDCKGIASGDASYCKTDDCKGIAKHDKSYCRTEDCKAWASGDASYCKTDDCKGIVKHDKSYCRNDNCKGIASDKLTVGSGVNSMHDREVFGQGSAGAGVSLRSPGLRFWRSPSAPFVGVMGQIEGGYALASGSDFSLQSSPGGSAENAIPTSPIAIGHVGRSAPYLRASLGIAF